VRVVVFGSRGWDDIHRIRMRLIRLPADSTVVVGGARGADTIAEWLADDFGFTVERYRAEWERLGRRAGIVRNVQMADTDPDLGLCFWDGTSRGTAHMLQVLQERGVPVEVHLLDGAVDYHAGVTGAENNTGAAA